MKYYKRLRHTRSLASWVLMFFGVLSVVALTDGFIVLYAADHSSSEIIPLSEFTLAVGFVLGGACFAVAHMFLDVVVYSWELEERGQHEIH